MSAYREHCAAFRAGDSRLVQFLNKPFGCFDSPCGYAHRSYTLTQKLVRVETLSGLRWRAIVVSQGGGHGGDEGWRTLNGHEVGYRGTQVLPFERSHRFPEVDRRKPAEFSEVLFGGAYRH